MSKSEFYEIVSMKDDKVCEDCRLLEGSKFYRSDYEKGVTAPPYHKDCRCKVVDTKPTPLEKTKEKKVKQPKPKQAKQTLPQEIIDITKSIETSSGNNSTTEDIVKNYYKSNGYKVMRAEVDFWQAMFALAFFEEVFSINVYLPNDIPVDLFRENFYTNRKKIIDEKYECLKTTNLYEFLNSQIQKYGNFKTRLLNNFPKAEQSIIKYFKTDIVQEFLKRIEPLTFAKVTNQIALNPNENRSGTQDFVVWNDKELIFVEVKQENEKMRDKQIKWAKFLLENNIPVVIMRVKELNSNKSMKPTRKPKAQKSGCLSMLAILSFSFIAFMFLILK